MKKILIFLLITLSYSETTTMVENVDSGDTYHLAEQEKQQTLKEGYDRTTFLLEKPSESTLSLKLKDGYFAKLTKINISTGEIKYKIIPNGSEEAVGFYSYINSNLKQSAEIKDNEITQHLASFKESENLQKEVKEIIKDDKALDLAQVLVFVVLLDQEKIDIEQSLTSNKIVLKDPYKRSFFEDTLDESALIFYIKFFVNLDNWLLNLSSFIFFLFVPYVLIALMAKKFIRTATKAEDGESVIERITIGFVILYFFYFSTTTNQISRTHFQTAYSVFVQESLELSTKLTNIFSTSFTSYQSRNSGKLDKKELENIVSNSLQNQKILPAYQKYFEKCLQTYDTNFWTRSVDEGYIFPSELSRNHLGSPWSERTTQKDTSVMPLTSLEFCHSTEASIKQINAKEVENKKILEDYRSALSDKLNQEQLALLQKMQMQNVHDLGFIAAPLIASNNMFSENLNMFQRTKKSSDDIETTISKVDKNAGLQKGVIADSVLGDMIELLPFMLVPGADSVKKTVTDSIGTVSSKFEALPFVGKFISAAKEATGIGVTIFLIKYVILYLPFVSLIVASFLVIIYYLISIIVYVNVTPFFAAFAFAQGQVDQLKSFFTKGVLLGLKPLILVISIIISVFSLNLIKVLNLFIIEKQLNNFFAMTQNTLSTAYAFSDLGLLFLKGFIALVISIAAAIIVFYVVLNGSDVIAHILGLDEKASGDTQSVVGNQIEQKTSRFSRM